MKKKANPASANTMHVTVGGTNSNNTVTSVSGDVHIGQFKLAWPFGRKQAKPASPAAPTAPLTALYDTLRTRFTLEEIENLCYELGIAPDELPARTRSGKARQLIEAATAHKSLAKLERIIERERPE